MILLLLAVFLISSTFAIYFLANKNYIPFARVSLIPMISGIALFVTSREELLKMPIVFSLLSLIVLASILSVVSHGIAHAVSSFMKQEDRKGIFRQIVFNAKV